MLFKIYECCGLLLSWGAVCLFQLPLQEALTAPRTFRRAPNKYFVLPDFYKVEIRALNKVNNLAAVDKDVRMDRSPILRRKLRKQKKIQSSHTVKTTYGQSLTQLKAVAYTMPNTYQPFDNYRLSIIFISR